ncbi:hypothetical protein, partial [Pseudomonas syringae group genomosp. 7]|uniref:hypothetical protein n=1 Tax=Pseudomonas syringae group genomosp. 7 TaxID=251699 RepID=UPI00376F9E7D
DGGCIYVTIRHVGWDLYSLERFVILFASQAAYLPVDGAVLFFFARSGRLVDQWLACLNGFVVSYQNVQLAGLHGAEPVLRAVAALQ